MIDVDVEKWRKAIQRARGKRGKKSFEFVPPGTIKGPFFMSGMLDAESQGKSDEEGCGALIGAIIGETEGEKG